MWAGRLLPESCECGAVGRGPRSFKRQDSLACALCSPSHAWPLPGCSGCWCSPQGAAVLPTLVSSPSYWVWVSTQDPRRSVHGKNVPEKKILSFLFILILLLAEIGLGLGLGFL